VDSLDIEVGYCAAGNLAVIAGNPLYLSRNTEAAGPGRCHRPGPRARRVGPAGPAYDPGPRLDPRQAGEGPDPGKAGGASPGTGPGQAPAPARYRDLWVPRTSSMSCDQAVFVDHATDASVSSDAVLLKIDRLG